MQTTLSSEGMNTGGAVGACCLVIMWETPPFHFPQLVPGHGR